MEYNTKTRMGIWFCLLLMLLVLSLVLAGVFDTARKESLAANGTKPDDDALYVHAGTQKTSESTSAETTSTSQTIFETTTPKKAENPIETETSSKTETEKRALYYVTVSGGNVVLLDEYGELLETLHENAMFLPKEDLAVLRAGIEVFSREELRALLDDLG